MSFKLDYNNIISSTKGLSENKIINSLNLTAQNKDNFLIRFFKTLLYPIYDFYKTFRSKNVIAKINEECRKVQNFDEDTAQALKDFIIAFDGKTHHKHHAILQELSEYIDGHCVKIQKEIPPYIDPELKTAMVLFRNEHPSLSQKSQGPIPFSNFLEQLLKGFPDQGPTVLKALLSNCFEIQKEFEKIKCDISLIEDRFKKWLVSTDQTFYLPSPLIFGNNKSHFSIITIAKEGENHLNISFPSEQGPRGDIIEREAFLSSFPQYLIQINQYSIAYLTNPEMTQANAQSLANLRIFQGSPKNSDESYPAMQKAVNLFLKTFFNDHFKAFQEIEKMNALLRALASQPNWIDDSDWRHWVKQCLIHLQKSHSTTKKIPAELEEQHRALKQKMYFLFQSITLAEQKLLPKTIPDPLKDPLSNTFALTLEWSPRISFPGTEALVEEADLPLQAAPLPRPLRYPDFANNDISGMKQWLEYLRNLKAQKDFSKLDFEATHLLLNLPSPKIFQVLEKPGFWVESLYENVSLMLHAHYALDRLIPHPSRTLAILKTMQIGIELYGFREEFSENSFAEYTKEILDVAFADSYHSLSVYGAEIMATWNSIKSTVPRLNKAKPSLLDQDQLKLLRQLFSFAQLFLCPQTALFSNDKPSKKRKSDDMGREIDQRYEELLQAFEPGRKKLNEGHSLEFSQDKTPILQPFGLVISHKGPDRFDDTTVYHKPHTPYFLQADRINDFERRIRVAEGLISSWSHPRNTTTLPIGFQATGSVFTQRDVQDEKFKFNNIALMASQDLMLMQSGPNNRTSNTFYVFAKYTYLLADKEWQQIFRLNLFRSGYLFIEINKNPEQAYHMIMKVEDMLSIAEKTQNKKAYLFLIRCCAEILTVVQTSNLSDTHKKKA